VDAFIYDRVTTLRRHDALQPIDDQLTSLDESRAACLASLHFGMSLVHELYRGKGRTQGYAAHELRGVRGKKAGPVMRPRVKLLIATSTDPVVTSKSKFVVGQTETRSPWLSAQVRSTSFFVLAQGSEIHIKPFYGSAVGRPGCNDNDLFSPITCSPIRAFVTASKEQAIPLDVGRVPWIKAL
jgi:hypothetical protein